MSLVSLIRVLCFLLSVHVVRRVERKWARELTSAVTTLLACDHSCAIATSQKSPENHHLCP
jgi:hypothetical protein